MPIAELHLEIHVTSKRRITFTSKGDAMITESSRCESGLRIVA